jgi:hypothetical protein
MKNKMNMTNQEKRIKIAEICGWTQIENTHTIVAGGVWRGYPPKMQIIGEKELIPDYLNDLNTMASAEKILTVKQAGEYCNNLIAIVYQGELSCPDFRDNSYMCFLVLRASAEQKADAFLQVFNK